MLNIPQILNEDLKITVKQCKEEINVRPGFARFEAGLVIVRSSGYYASFLSILWSIASSNHSVCCCLRWAGV
jgi:hypothetical protein